MARLLEISPGAGLLPATAGSCTLAELTPDAITSISPHRGKTAVVSAALKRLHGVTFPRPNRATGKDGARCIWFGPDQAMLVGAKIGALKDAAITEQSDGWAVLRLHGRDAPTVLARLVPVDVRARAFKRGHCARTLLDHMPVSIMRTGADSFDIMVFRSMTRTAVEVLSAAMKSLAAQNN